jgi:hypothetical protein
VASIPNTGGAISTLASIGGTMFYFGVPEARNNAAAVDHGPLLPEAGRWLTWLQRGD